MLVALAETTPVAEAAELQADLRRAGIEPFGWVLNAVLAGSGTTDPLLQARARLEVPADHACRRARHARCGSHRSTLRSPKATQPHRSARELA